MLELDCNKMTHFSISLAILNSITSVCISQKTMKHYYQQSMNFIFITLVYGFFLLEQQQQHNSVSCLQVSLSSSHSSVNALKDSVKIHLRSDDDKDDKDDADDNDDDKTTDSASSEKHKHKDKESKSSGDDSDDKYNLKMIISTGVMVATVLIIAFLCFLGICKYCW